MAKKTQSATGQQAQIEPPDQAEQKLPAEQQGGERTRSGRTFRPRVDIRETERDSSSWQMCPALGRTA